MALKFSVALISSLFLLASIANIADSAIFDVTKSYGAKTNGDIAKVCKLLHAAVQFELCCIKYGSVRNIAHDLHAL